MNTTFLKVNNIFKKKALHCCSDTGGLLWLLMGTQQINPAPTAPCLATDDSKAGCCHWTWPELLWDERSGLKVLKSFSECISRLCQYLRNVAFHGLFCVTSFYLAVTLNTMISPVMTALQGQTWQNHVEGPAHHQYHWPLYCDIRALSESICLSSFSGLPSAGMALRFPTWEGRSHWCFAVDVIWCLFPQDCLFKCFLCFQEGWGEEKKRGLLKRKFQVPWYLGKGYILQQGVSLIPGVTFHRKQPSPFHKRTQPFPTRNANNSGILKSQPGVDIYNSHKGLSLLTPDGIRDMGFPLFRL